MCFGGCLVNFFSSNTPCTCLDSGFSNREIVLFNIFYVYPLFFSLYFCGDLGLFTYIFFPLDGFSNPEIQLFKNYLYIWWVQDSMQADTPRGWPEWKGAQPPRAAEQPRAALVWPAWADRERGVWPPGLVAGRLTCAVDQIGSYPCCAVLVSLVSIFLLIHRPAFLD